MRAAFPSGLERAARRARPPRLSLQIDMENISNRVYLIAQEGEFAPAQFSIPRLISATAKI